MRIFKLTHLVLDINEAFASRKAPKITGAEVIRHIEDGTIFQFLIERLPFSGSIEVLDPIDRLELLVEWSRFGQGKELITFDRYQNGWCLLVAFLMESIARRCERKNYRLTPEICGEAFTETEPVAAPVVQRPPTGKFCTTCKKPCDPLSNTAETGRDALCICCCKWFCEPCLFDHQKSPDYDNPFLRGRKKTDDGSHQAGSPTE